MKARLLMPLLAALLSGCAVAPGVWVGLDGWLSYRANACEPKRAVMIRLYGVRSPR